jgi:MoaA/NifB/PqqE/SkfB family radical SAM enzyme
MTDPLYVLYRGRLKSCNYACDYCPFAKGQDDRASLARDAADLSRFVAWAARARRPLAILFTPWGEALIRRHYRTAMVELSHVREVVKVAIQTNLSCELGWIREANRETIALWCTYHPSQVERASFLAQCAELGDAGIRFSVGMVGLKQDMDEIRAMRRALPADVYLWINAYKARPEYYSDDDVRTLTEIDPLFSLNRTSHASLGESCRSGERAITVDGDGTVRRCHFVPSPIGNLYAPDFEESLRPRPCPNTECRCHIGYAHLEKLHLDDVFGDGILERIPAPFGKRSLPTVAS